MCSRHGAHAKAHRTSAVVTYAMPAPAVPLIGFNNNVKYRGLRFHLQTEDSGRDRPHILTHLFANGGHIIQSVRQDYSQHLDDPKCAEIVARMMKKQHLDVALQLREGKLDSKIEYLLKEEKPAPPPPSVRDKTQAPPSVRRPPSAVFRVSAEESLDDVIMNYLSEVESDAEP